MSDPNTAEAHPLRIFIFDSARLRSHLLFRFLSTSAQIKPIYHPFLMPAMFGLEHIGQYLNHSAARAKELEDRMEFVSRDYNFETCQQHFTDGVAHAERNGKIPLANEHWYNVMKPDIVLNLIRDNIQYNNQLGGNPTHIPDEFFTTLTPIVLIRNPVLSMDSIYRTTLQFTTQRPGDEDFDQVAINRPIRILFEYFKAQGRQPIVIDAEDLIWRSNDVIQNLCIALGGVLDPTQFSDTWAPTPRDEVDKINPLVYALTKTIHDSNGIQRPKEMPRVRDVDEAALEWIRQYGDSIGARLKGLAEANMVHYEYLKQFKI